MSATAPKTSFFSMASLSKAKNFLLWEPRPQPLPTTQTYTYEPTTSPYQQPNTTPIGFEVDDAFDYETNIDDGFDDVISKAIGQVDKKSDGKVDALKEDKDSSAFLSSIAGRAASFIKQHFGGKSEDELKAMNGEADKVVLTIRGGAKPKRNILFKPYDSDDGEFEFTEVVTIDEEVEYEHVSGLDVDALPKEAKPLADGFEEESYSVEEKSYESFDLLVEASESSGSEEYILIKTARKRRPEDFIVIVDDPEDGADNAKEEDDDEDSSSSS